MGPVTPAINEPTVKTNVFNYSHLTIANEHTKLSALAQYYTVDIFLYIDFIGSSMHITNTARHKLGAGLIFDLFPTDVPTALTTQKLKQGRLDASCYGSWDSHSYSDHTHFLYYEIIEILQLQIYYVQMSV